MKALDRIAYKEESTLYRKKGRKYVPVSDPYAYEGLDKGWWLVQVREGCTSIRAAVYPHRAEVEAAIKEKADKIEDILFEATQARPKNRTISPEFRKDWEALIEKHGKEMSVFEYDSIAGISEKIITKLTEK